MVSPPRALSIGERMGVLVPAAACGRRRRARVALSWPRAASSWPSAAAPCCCGARTPVVSISRMGTPATGGGRAGAPTTGGTNTGPAATGGATRGTGTNRGRGTDGNGGRELGRQRPCCRYCRNARPLRAQLIVHSIPVTDVNSAVALNSGHLMWRQALAVPGVLPQPSLGP